MVGEALAGLSAFKAMYDAAKALKDINDATVRNAAVIELQEKILAAQESQTTLLGRVRELEEKVARFETWDTEKKRYELKDLGWGALAYMLKAEARRAEPPHWACTNCYSNRQISIIQRAPVPQQGYRPVCPACKSIIRPAPEAMNGDGAKWLD